MASTSGASDVHDDDDDGDHQRSRGLGWSSLRRALEQHPWRESASSSSHGGALRETSQDLTAVLVHDNGDNDTHNDADASRDRTNSRKDHNTSQDHSISNSHHQGAAGTPRIMNGGVGRSRSRAQSFDDLLKAQTPPPTPEAAVRRDSVRHSDTPRGALPPSTEKMPIIFFDVCSFFIIFIILLRRTHTAHPCPFILPHSLLEVSVCVLCSFIHI